MRRLGTVHVERRIDECWETDSCEGAESTFTPTGRPDTCDGYLCYIAATLRLHLRSGLWGRCFQLVLRDRRRRAMVKRARRSRRHWLLPNLRCWSYLYMVRFALIQIKRQWHVPRRHGARDGGTTPPYMYAQHSRAQPSTLNTDTPTFARHNH